MTAPRLAYYWHVCRKNSIKKHTIVHCFEKLFLLENYWNCDEQHRCEVDGKRWLKVSRINWSNFEKNHHQIECWGRNFGILENSHLPFSYSLNRLNRIWNSLQMYVNVWLQRLQISHAATKQWIGQYSIKDCLDH